MNVRVLNFLRKKYKTLELINKKKTLTENADSTKTLADVQKGKKESYSLKSVVNTQSEEINSQTKIKEKKNSVVDDEFFKVSVIIVKVLLFYFYEWFLQELEEFLDEMEDKDSKNILRHSDPDGTDV
jgi:hypothetical protein